MKEGTKRIDFRIVAPQAENVHLCGSFNNWLENADPVKKDGAGTWKETKMLSEGTHEVNFSLMMNGPLIPSALKPLSTSLERKTM